jgi:hypothetical protein
MVRRGSTVRVRQRALAMRRPGRRSPFAVVRVAAGGLRSGDAQFEDLPGADVSLEPLLFFGSILIAIFGALFLGASEGDDSD